MYSLCAMYDVMMCVCRILIKITYLLTYISLSDADMLFSSLSAFLNSALCPFFRTCIPHFTRRQFSAFRNLPLAASVPVTLAVTRVGFCTYTLLKF